MTAIPEVYETHPPHQRWTHLALIVKNIDASITWYEKYTHLELLDRNSDENGRGAWLGDRKQAASPFVLVLAEFFEGHDPFAPARHGILGPFAHIGIEVTEREEVDRIAALGKENGCLGLGPMQMPAPVGYICFLNDPDGNTIEFSFDQGVYETARRVWGNESD